MERITTATVRFDAILALVAGFLDAYTYLKRGNVFATAQTGNVVLLGLNLAQHHFSLAARKLAPPGAFAAGVILAETIRRPSVAGWLRRPFRVVLLIEAIVLLVVGALPSPVPDAVATILVAFVASVQLTTFPHPRGLARQHGHDHRKPAIGAHRRVEIGLHAVWIAAAILLGALALFVIDERP